MPKIPGISHAQAIRALWKAGFGVAWWLKGESREILVQWMETQVGFQVLKYTLAFLLPCAGGAAVAAAMHRSVNRKQGT